MLARRGAGVSWALWLASSLAWAAACGRAKAPAERGPAVPATVDLLADPAGWQGSGWRFESPDGGPEGLSVHACCTGGGVFNRALPVATGGQAVRIRYANTECDHLVSAAIQLHDETGDAAPWDRWHSLTEVVLDGPSGTKDLTFALDAQPPAGTRLTLTLFTHGGLRCCGRTRISGAVLLP
jgi:hypothetical protein